MRIDSGSHTPIYQQIVDQLRESIAAGAYRPGEMLPSQRDLAVRLKVNPNTVQRAYETLEREGLVHPRRGLGMFVSNRAVRQARAGAEEQLRETLTRPIERGAAAGLALDEIRRLFDEALRSNLHARGANR